MRLRIIIFSLILVTGRLYCQVIPFDNDWKFHLGGAQYAEQPGFDDSSWRNIDVPHDWSIEDLPGTDSPFDRDAISQVSGGFTTGGTGWYRKTFDIGADQKDKRFIIQFDGIYMNPEIWVNGISLGSHPYGYTSFWYDITGKVKPGKSNVIAIKVRNEGENSRWYSGSGVNRHVWLKITEQIHFATWGTAITTTEINQGSARVSVRSKVQNQSTENSSIKLITRILDSGGVEKGSAESEQTISKSGESDFMNEVTISQPELWSLSNPAMYTAVNEIFQNGKTIGKEEIRLGIRTVKIDMEKGFQLNGMTIKLKGGCYHNDNGPLGSRSFDRAEERRVELLKASGFNAIRCSHNPPAPAFLDACDRLGMLVIDEAFDMWQYPKNPADYSLYFDKWWQKDIQSMVLRDRNHPSVVIWSIGNEIPGMDSPEVVKTASMLSGYVRQLDPGRPVIAAVNNLNERKDPFFATLDIAGYNYGSGGDHMKPNIFITDHERIPSRIMIQTESYPLEAFQSWMDVVDFTWLLGDFVWTAFDYIGEASIGWLGYMQEQRFFPWNLAYCGDIDICGWKRPQSFYRDALWKENQVSIFVKPPSPSFPENQARMSWSKWHWPDAVADWNWEGFENKPLEVTVYSSCESVELFLNGKSLGKKAINRSTQFMASWQVPYQQGEIKAIGYSGRKKINTASLRSAGPASKIRLYCDRGSIKANGQDLSYVTVELTDNGGIRNPKAGNQVSFEIEGPGSIVAVGNANPMSLESYQDTSRKAWQGKCLVIVKSGSQPGEIRLKAHSPGLISADILIKSGN